MARRLLFHTNFWAAAQKGMMSCNLEDIILFGATTLLLSMPYRTHMGSFLFVLSSIHPFVHPSVLSICPFVHPSFHQSIHPPLPSSGLQKKKKKKKEKEKEKEKKKKKKRRKQESKKGILNVVVSWFSTVSENKRSLVVFLVHVIFVFVVFLVHVIFQDSKCDGA